ncbi:Sensor kinase CusS [Nonomuraea coxensis DSM 45129]|uniref:histidine kinase n=1 Tax=Nonomuraea coxensis DSM 45129 TaxID=1122611 RepID=A0ABX8U455_9ACTN|nr:HAMP domain-containing sensor histidine kinase [Nonomuraea coxensis]QYC41534.1 Sensor kinase CusS [Nonomuraea coxensis DSM 45129]
MTVATVTLFGVILFAGVFVISSLFLARARDDLQEQAEAAARRLTVLIDRSRFTGPIPKQDDVPFFQVVDGAGRVLAADAELDGAPPLTRARPGRGESLVRDRVCGERSATDAVPPGTCLVVVGMADETSAYGPVMAYAAVREPVMLRSPFLPVLLYGSAAVLLALMAWGTWYGVGRVLAPVDRIRRDLRRISAEDLSRRVEVPPGGDEVAELAVTVNDTLERLENAVERHRRFVSDASHELRSPLTAMTVRLEAGLDERRDEDWAAALADAYRLSAIVQDLLMLARLDAAPPVRDERIDLGALVSEEISRRGRTRLPVTASIQPGVIVRGHRLRLARVLTNLLSNADRYGDTRVHVTVRAAGELAEVEVLDDGPGIPPEMRERVFERFTRLDATRSRDTGGSGLGLPIARDIAQAHGGTLLAGEGPGGRLILRLLRDPSDPAVADPPAGDPAAEGAEAGDSDLKESDQ